MIELIFYFGTEIIFIRVNGNRVSFASSSNGAIEATIDGLKLSKAGVIKEFPDLKDREDWRTEAINRFKKKIHELSSEEAVSEYIINDFKKFGYTPKWKQRRGFRREAIT